MFFRRKLTLENLNLVVQKSARKLLLLDGERLVKVYRIALGFEPIGDKFCEGDGRTPEGEFFVRVKNPKSKYFLSLGLNYPTLKHAERGLKSKLIEPSEYEGILKANDERRLPFQKTRLGGEIYLHGGGVLWDWTEGCIALENSAMREIFETVEIGAKILIEP